MKLILLYLTLFFFLFPTFSISALTDKEVKLLEKFHEYQENKNYIESAKLAKQIIDEVDFDKEIVRVINSEDKKVKDILIYIGQAFGEFSKAFLKTKDFDLSIKMAFKALEIFQKTDPKRYDWIAFSNRKIGELYYKIADYEKAEKYGLESKNIFEEFFPNDWLNLSNVYRFLMAVESKRNGPNENGINYLKKALEKIESFTPANENEQKRKNEQLANTYNDLGFVLSRTGKYQEAESFYLKTIEIDDFVIVKLNLANLYTDLSQFEKADKILKEAFQQAIKEHEDDDRILHMLYNQLGKNELALQNYKSAKNYLLKSIEILKKEKHNILSFSVVLNNLAAVEDGLGNRKEAIRLYEESIAIHEKKLKKNHPRLFTGYNNLALIYTKEIETIVPKEATDLLIEKVHQENEKKIQKAHEYFEKATIVAESAFGTEHYQTATVLGNWGNLYMITRNYKLAEAIFEKSLEISIKVLPSDHAFLALSYQYLGAAITYLDRQWEALDYFRKASNVYFKRSQQGWDVSTSSYELDQKQRKTILFKHIEQIFYLLYGGEETTNWSMNKDTGKITMSEDLSLKKRKELIEELFKISQLYKSDDFSLQMTSLEARYKSETSEVFTLARNRENLLIKREQLRNKNLELIKEGEFSKTNKEIDNSIKKLNKEIALVNNSLKSKYENYKNFLTPPVLKIKYIQKYLKKNQAFLYFIIGEYFGYSFLVKTNEIQLQPIIIGNDQMKNLITGVRESIDDLNVKKIKEFNYDLSSSLYYFLFDNQGLSDHLDDIENLIVVPDASLWSVPFSILITENTNQDKYVQIKKEQNYEKIPWLIDKFSISYMPSVGSFKSIRESKISIKTKEEFIGFGNPILANYNNKLRGVLTKAIIKEDILKRYTSIPNTEDELKKISRSLGNHERNIFVGKEATETNVKKQQLNNKKVIVFATHAEVSGVVKGVYEPFIILTPPKEPNDLDDGILTASEISFLDLNASWVILSACNTARDYTLNANGLSGLTRAFLYAGSETVLASHWYVENISSEKITTGIFEKLNEDLNLSKAEAHRLSILNLKKNKKYSHPYYWAPFVVIGKAEKL